MSKRESLERRWERVRTVPGLGGDPDQRVDLHPVE